MEPLAAPVKLPPPPRPPAPPTTGFFDDPWEGDPEEEEEIFLLMAQGLLTEEGLATARMFAAMEGRPLMESLGQGTTITEVDLVRVLAEAAGYTFIDLDDYVIDPKAASMIGPTLAKRCMALPLTYKEDRLVIAMADPSDVIAHDELQSVTGAEISVVAAAASQIEVRIANYEDLVYPRGHAVLLRRPRSRHPEAPAPIEDFDTVDEIEDELPSGKVEDASLVEALNLILSRAQETDAAVIHVKPDQGSLRVRFRDNDGRLSEALRFPAAFRRPLADRIKAMAGLDITEHHLPQEGELTVEVSEAEVSMTVTVIPGIWGETVVLKLRKERGGCL